MDNTKLPAYPTKIFCFVNGGNERDWFQVIALCEDGHCLAQHISSSVRFAMHDIGINSEIKHENYKGHCPNGYELVWVNADEVIGHTEIDAAYAKKAAISSQSSTRRS